MNTTQPPRARRARIHERISRTAQNTALTLAGVAAIVWTPNTISDELGSWLTTIWPILVIGGGLASAVGAATDKIRLEWPAVWLSIGGISAYAATVWELVHGGALTRATQALALTAMALPWITRHFSLAVKAADARAEADARGEIAASLPSGDE